MPFWTTPVNYCKHFHKRAKSSGSNLQHFFLLSKKNSQTTMKLNIFSEISHRLRGLAQVIVVNFWWNHLLTHPRYLTNNKELSKMTVCSQCPLFPWGAMEKKKNVNFIGKKCILSALSCTSEAEDWTNHCAKPFWGMLKRAQVPTLESQSRAQHLY